MKYPRFQPIENEDVFRKKIVDLKTFSEDGGRLFVGDDCFLCVKTHGNLRERGAYLDPSLEWKIVTDDIGGAVLIAFDKED